MILKQKKKIILSQCYDQYVQLRVTKLRSACVKFISMSFRQQYSFFFSLYEIVSLWRYLQQQPDQCIWSKALFEFHLANDVQLTIFLTSFAVLGTSFRLLQIHIRCLLIVHTFHHPPLVTQIDSVLRLNIMKSPGCNAWRDEPMRVCCNDRCVDAK